MVLRAGQEPRANALGRHLEHFETDGEALYRSHRLNAGISANRTTEAWKIRLNGNFSYDQSKYSFSDGTTYTSLQRSFGLSALTVKSVNAHWSVGGRERMV